MSKRLSPAALKAIRDSPEPTDLKDFAMWTATRLLLAEIDALEAGTTEVRRSLFERCYNCNSRDIVCMEYQPDHPDHYDGVSEIGCRACGRRTGRWSERELGEWETEPRYGIRRIDSSK